MLSRSPWGLVLNAVEQCQGLKKGQKIVRICQIRALSVRRETLLQVNQRECEREGFPSMSPADFRHFFIKTHKKCDLSTLLTRIEFEFCDDAKEEAKI